MSPLYALRGFRLQRGGRTVLDIPQLDIPGDGITAIVGPNGAGKSSLLHVLALLDEVPTGEACFRGEKLTGASISRLRRKVGLVPQNPFLFDRSVEDNVLTALRLQDCPRAALQARTEAALGLLGLLPLARRHARQLSGGEAQKLAIARVLALEPEVLLLDEPFTYLDAHAAEELVALVETLSVSSPRKVIFSTHDQSLAARLAGQVVGLIEGRAQAGLLFNHFKGRLEPALHAFDVGALRIFVPDHVRTGSHVVIDPAHIVLSVQRLESSMRNEFPGRVVELVEQGGDVRVSVDAGERLHALVTHQTVRALGLGPGSEVWVGFKANAVAVF